MPAEGFPFDFASPAASSYYRFCSLIASCSKPGLRDGNAGLGGQLLYAAELDQEGRDIVVAGNVAGCATLAASSDVATQKQAIRDGVVDFLVTSLNEALRILKNEVRKKATVAVCVGLSGAEIEREMIERGVRPDLTREQAEACSGLFSKSDSSSPLATLVWEVEKAPAKWLPILDRVALDCLDSSDTWNRRWLRLSPRYLGRLAPGVRVLVANQEFVLHFVESTHLRYQRGDMEVEATIRVSSHAGSDEHRFLPVGRC